MFCSRLKSVLYETDDLWEICFTGAEELSCLGRIVYSCLMNECSIKTVSLDLFILSTNLNISLLIFSTKLEVKLSWTIIFKFLYFFFPFFKISWPFLNSKDALSVWTDLGKNFVVRLVMRLKYKDGHKTHYASKRTTFRSASFNTYDSSSRRIMRLVPVFILETHNQTNYKMFAQVRPTDNATVV